MAGNKYLSVGSAGEQQEVTSVQASAGAGDASKIVALNAAGLIDQTMLAEAQTISILPSEALSAGAFINIYNNAGVTSARNADNTAVAKKAHGFVTAGYASGVAATVFLSDGPNTAVTALTVGVEYFLGTAGGIVVGASIPTSTGSIVQRLGVSKSATELEVNIVDTVMIRA